MLRLEGKHEKQLTSFPIRQLAKVFLRRFLRRQTIWDKPGINSVIHADSLAIDLNAPAIVVWVGESYQYHFFFFETIISARAFLSFIPSIIQTNL